MAEQHKYKLEYIFIDLSDNDFNFAMMDFAESLIRAFERGTFTVEKCKDNVKEVFPRMMACSCHLDECEAGKPEELKHHEEYFANQAEYLFDFEEIKGYLNENASNWSGNNNPLDWEDWEVVRNVASDKWLSDLKLNLNAEAILIQFVSIAKNGKPAKGKSSYKIF